MNMELLSAASLVIGLLIALFIESFESSKIRKIALAIMIVFITIGVVMALLLNI